MVATRNQKLSWSDQSTPVHIIQADNKNSKHLCTHSALGWKQLCKSDGRQENLNLLVRTMSSCKSSFEGGNSPFCLTILSTSCYRAVALTMIKSMLTNKGHVSTYDACTYSDVQISKLGCLMLTTNDHISLFGQTVNFKCAKLLSRGMVWISLWWSPVLVHCMFRKIELLFLCHPVGNQEGLCLNHYSTY